MENEYFYSTEIEWIAQRKGNLSGPHLPDLLIDAPPEFKGQDGFWTPEHLLVASVNSCFMTTFLAIAENSKLDVMGLHIEAKGQLEKLEGVGFMMTEIILRPRVILARDRDSDRALRIIGKAERNCLIASSIRTKITVEPELSVAPVSNDEVLRTIHSPNALVENSSKEAIR